MPNLDRSLCALTLLLIACGDGMPGDEPSETTGEPTGTSPTDPTEPTEPPPSVDPFGGAYPQADLTDPQVVQALSVGSAQGMILFSTWPLREIDESDPCPSVTVEGDTSTVTGGCTDALGQEWFGTLIVQTERIEYRQFGRRQSFLCDVGVEEVVTSIAFDGAVVDVSESDVRIDLTVQGQVGRPTDCVEEPVGVEARYDATVSSDGSGVSLSGEGALGTIDEGWTLVATFDQVVDDTVCSSQPLEGTTILQTDDHEARIRYDGSTDCDPDARAPWSLDGVDQGELERVACATGAGPASWLLLGAGLLLLRRRE